MRAGTEGLEQRGEVSTALEPGAGWCVSPPPPPRIASREGEAATKRGGREWSSKGKGVYSWQCVASRPLPHAISLPLSSERQVRHTVLDLKQRWGGRGRARA